MTAAYPVAVTKYWMGECKQMEKCINDLQSCIDSRCVGTDETKCITAMCINCHSMADECAAKASSCNNCGDGKCDKAAGEDQNTCCQDCGCLEDMVCKSGGLFSDPECKELATDGGPLCFPWFLGLPLVSLAASLASKAMCVG